MIFTRLLWIVTGTGRETESNTSRQEAVSNYFGFGISGFGLTAIPEAKHNCSKHEIVNGK